MNDNHRLLKIFVNRNKPYAMQKDEGGYLKIDEEVTDEVLKKHLNGEITIGTYQIYPKNPPNFPNDVVEWICWDFDGKILEEEKGKAIKLFNKLQNEGFHPIIEFSGMKGYHIWIFGTTTSNNAYNWGRIVADGYKYNEVFPKQRGLDESSPLGNLVKVPLGIHRINKRRSIFLNPITFEELDLQSSLELLRNLQHDYIPIVKDIERNKREEIEPIVEKTKLPIPPEIVFLIEHGADTGKRHETAYIIIKELFNAGYTLDEIKGYILEFNENCRPPKTEDIVIDHVERLYKEAEKRLEKKWDDVRWFFNDKNDTKDPQKGIWEAAKKILSIHVIKTMTENHDVWYYDKKEGHYKDGGEELIESIIQSKLGEVGTTRVTNEVTHHIRGLTYVEENEFDKDIDKIVMKNGVLDLKTRVVVPHDPKFLLSIKIPIIYDPNADCLKIKEFLQQVLYKDDIPVIQELLGYCLLRSYHIQKAFMFLGSGANGKSTLTNVIRKFLGGDNVSSVTLQDLDINRFASAKLYKKLANIYPDLPDASLYNTGKFKALTGGDVLTGEKKFKEAFSFVNFAKLIFSANRLPESKDKSDAFYRRWVFINFPNVFDETKADKRLIDKLTSEEELSGLFNWVLEGLKRLEENGGFSCSRTTDEIALMYKKLSSPVEAFISEKVVEDSKEFITKEGLYTEFIKYCKENKMPTFAQNAFAIKLKETGTRVESQRTIIGTRRSVPIWRGIRFRTNEEMESEEEKEEMGLDKFV